MNSGNSIYSGQPPSTQHAFSSAMQDFSIKPIPTSANTNFMDQSINGFIKQVPQGYEMQNKLLQNRQTGIESRQSDVCRKVIEDLAIKYSTIDRRSGSINPRRQNPIVK